MMTVRAASRRRRKPGHVAGVLLLLGLAAPFAVGLVPSTSVLAARQKPGPVTIRGVAATVHRGGFTLQTASHGSYSVVTTSATQVTEKGNSGRVLVQEGDHVGVHGFEQGRQIRAIWVHIYPTKAKPQISTVKGSVRAVNGTVLIVGTSSGTVSIAVSSHTEVRLGNATASLRQVHVGDTISVRVQKSGRTLIAVRVHIYARRAVARHVELRGTVVSVSSRGLVVSSAGRRYQVAVGRSTTIYLGAGRGSAGLLKPGQLVTVHACCLGQALAATSIHIRVTHARPSSTLLRGTVRSVSADRLVLTVGRGVETIQLQPDTVYEVGSARVGRSGVRAGDQVSVRAVRSGASWKAERVHVYAGARRPRTVEGVVIAVSQRGVVVLSRGEKVLLTPTRNAGIQEGGRRVGLGSIHAGDHVRAVGLASGPQSISASSIVVRPAVVKSVVLRGTVAEVSGATVVVVDSSGAHYSVRIVAGTRLRWHGAPAPASALFAGAAVTVHGHLSGSAIVASELTFDLKSRRVSGRVGAATRTHLTVRLSSGRAVRVDLPSGVSLADGRKHPGTVSVGAYVKVQGFAESGGAVRALAVQIEHPHLTVSGTVLATAPAVVVATASDRFRLRLTGSSAISAERTHVPLKAKDIPSGARVRAAGTMQSDGTLLVSELVVRLANVTLRGHLTSIGSGLALQAGSGPVQIRLEAATPVMQGSHTLSLSDLVVGDDVTVYGYQLGGATVLARKLVVHRRLLGIDGTVASLTSDGFTLTAADGTHLVLMGSATVLTGGTAADIQPGVSLHVTGYLRGDGSIVATRVRLGK